MDAWFQLNLPNMSLKVDYKEALNLDKNVRDIYTP